MSAAVRAAELARFVAFPTVSADPSSQPALAACARWLAERVEASGFPSVDTVSAGGAPAVIADWHVDSQLPTLLLYGHYDVQPPGARSGWKANPFQLRRERHRLFGRGAADDKGFVLAQLHAVERVIRKPAGRPPVNLRCLYEGEEEVGSPTMRQLLGRYRDQVAADAGVVCDTEGTSTHRPTLTLSCRGEITVRIEVRGPTHDLHAGRFGGAIHDPAQVLAEILAELHDEEGRVRLSGFYRNLRPLRPAPVRSDAAVLSSAGVSSGWGEPGFTLDERITARPALIVTSLASGSSPDGPNHIIPGRAVAQINIRLVPDQDPGQVYHSVRRHVARYASPGARPAVSLLLAVRPWMARTPHPAVTAAVNAVRTTTGKSPLLVRSGGSIPALTALDDTGTVETSVLLGFGHPCDRAHGPEESIDRRQLDLASATIARLLQGYAKIHR